MSSKERFRSSPMYLPYARMKYGPERIVCPETDLVIEGYPRSANTFAVEAFRRVNPNRRLAHHVHSAAQVIGALRHSIPALVLIREPSEAIASWMVYEHTTAEAALDRWLWFHRPLARWVSHFVVADFREVTQDFASVVKKVNRFYGPCFVAHTPTDSERADIFAEIARTEQWQDDRKVPVPSSQRNAMKLFAGTMLSTVNLGEANELYHLFRRESVRT